MAREPSSSVVDHGGNVFPIRKQRAARTPQRIEAARRLRVARAETGLTQQDVAALLGVDRTTVQRRECGEVDLGPLEQLVLLEWRAGERKAA